MTALIQLEVEDLVDAARTLADQGGERMLVAVEHCLSRLQDSAGMAGNDPAGQDWARAYEQAAGATVGATQDVLNGVFHLAAMLSQTARNYAAADAASTVGVRHAVDVALAQVPYTAPVTLAIGLPSAVGDGSLPGHWGLVEHLVGYVWPNGHQDRLHAAAAAWHRCGDAVSDGAFQVALAGLRPVVDHLPEADDIYAVTQSLAAQVREVAAAHHRLADACEQLARHLDECHAAVLDEIGSFIDWSAGIQVGGAVLSIVTAGAAEVPTQAVQAARLARTAATIAALIEKFAAAVRLAAGAVGAVVDRVAAASARLRALLGIKLSAATLTLVQRVRIVRASGELGELAISRRRWTTLSAILRKATAGRGFYGLGTVSAHEADLIGRAWVGDGARYIERGKIRLWISKDNLRQYRLPTYKDKLGKVQANIEARPSPRGDWIHNGHLDIEG